MSKTIELARCLGTPLLNEGKPFQLTESDELLDLAFANGVELIYLENLKQAGKLNALASKLDEFHLRRSKTNECIVRIATAMDELDIPYSITKTLRPYPGTPNDTDLLYLGPLKEYKNAVKAFESKGFVIGEKGVLIQTEFFDPMGGEIFQKDKRGGRFYIDFYSQLAADYVAYMDSSRIKNKTRKYYVSGYEVNIFEPVTEMIILYLHSVIMHRTFPLEVFWSTAIWIDALDQDGINGFLQEIRSHHSVLSSRTAFTLMVELYNAAYGSVPDKISYILNSLGGEVQSEKRKFIASEYHSPHITTFNTWMFSVFEKIREWNSMKGFLKELIMMANPLFFINVMHHMFSKNQIKKHSTHV